MNEAMVATEILIIEDDVLLRRVMLRYLERLGYAVCTAGDGQSGIDSCRSRQPSLVLCDLRMPGMDGLEVLGVLGREFPELPVIVVSGMGEIGDAIAALKAGAWDYLTKPIKSFAVLDHAVRVALERASLRSENRSYREHLETLNGQLEHSLRQVREDETAARNIQFQLLPEERKRFAASDGSASYECSYCLRTSAILSGDFIDYFEIDADHFGFYMADVSGHGVASAFITVLLKSYMGRYLERNRQLGDRSIFDPAAVLSGLNRDILSGGYGKHLTMFYAVLNLSAARLVFANGGQFPFPILYDGERTQAIGGRSPPVGLFDYAQDQTQTLDISPVFGISLFSDGVLEVLTQPGLPEKQAYLHALVGAGGDDAHALASSLRLAEGSAPPDDISILSLRRLASA